MRNVWTPFDSLKWSSNWLYDQEMTGSSKTNAKLPFICEIYVLSKTYLFEVNKINTIVWTPENQKSIILSYVIYKLNCAQWNNVHNETMHNVTMCNVLWKPAMNYSQHHENYTGSHYFPKSDKCIQLFGPVEITSKYV